MTPVITFSLTPDQIIGALVHNESYVNSLLNNISGTMMWHQVKWEAIEKYIEANEDNMRDLAIEHMLENHEDDIRAAAVQWMVDDWNEDVLGAAVEKIMKTDEKGVRAAAAQQLIDERYEELSDAAIQKLIDDCDLIEDAVQKYIEDNEDEVRDAAIQKLIDDGDVTDDAVQKYIDDNEIEVREAAIEKIMDSDGDFLQREAIKYYYEEHEESCIYEAAKLYQQQNFADVENAAVESLVQSMFNGDPYGLTIKVAKAWAEHRKQDAQDLDKMAARQQLEAQIEDIKKKQQEIELAIAKLGI